MTDLMEAGRSVLRRDQTTMMSRPDSPKVLLAYDGSEPSRRALDRVTSFMPNASVTVISVAAPVYRDPRLIKFAHDHEAQRQQGALAEAKARLAETCINAASATPVGDAAAEIVRIAEERRADLIVLGARGLNRVKRVVLGSVSTKVLHQAPCDVLIVK